MPVSKFRVVSYALCSMITVGVILQQPKTTVILKHCYLFTHWLVRTSDQCILIVEAFRCVLFLNKLNKYLIEAQYGRQKRKIND